MPGAHPKDVSALIDAVSKHLAGVELRALVLLLLKIKTSNDRLWWINELASWYERHKDYLSEKTYNENTGRYWYKHKLLRRSYFTIKRALPNKFHLPQQSQNTSYYQRH